MSRLKYFYNKDYFITELLKPKQALLESLLTDIHIKQYELTNHYNFFYKGSVYPYKEVGDFHALHTSLKPKYTEYKLQCQHLLNHRENLLSYFKKINENNVYQYFPKSCHWLLEESGYFKPITTDTCECPKEITQIIEECLLLRLVT